jgi:thiol-disulfide isomerase/thioredoxin
MEEPVVNARTARWSSYLVALLITALIFATALYASNYFNNQRINDIRATQDDISTQILSTETQFDLLEEHSCSDVSENTTLPSEMTSLGSELSYLEAQGGNQDEITRLKGMYSLLEIKDYLVMQQLAAKCNLKPVFILYFYSNKGDCTDCEAQGDVLTALSQQYPELRVYSFDYNLQVGALQTLVSIDDVKYDLPALVINGKVYYGFQSIDAIHTILPQLATLQSASSSAATSTKK